FEDLEIWQKSRQLSLKIFELTNDGPFSKDYRFRDQIRAAAGSIMDNIAEGFERSSRLEFVNSLSFSKGSAGEVKSQLYRALDQKYCKKDEFDILYNEYNQLSGQIAGFISYLNKSGIKVQKFKDRS
ncbi:MAG TPA: four helix bundle protein, partial [Chitinophagaceae bacterium]|nr:four helix bundle protein [Chitinophagaceae bacterium]